MAIEFPQPQMPVEDEEMLEGEEIMEILAEQFGESINKGDSRDLLIDTVIPSMRDPYHAFREAADVDLTLPDFDTNAQVFAQGSLEYLKRSLGYPKGSEFKNALRDIKEADPLGYRGLLEAARDTDMTVAEMTPKLSFQKRLEAAREMAEKAGYPFDMQKFLDRYGYPADFNPDLSMKP